jgi:hypothetical protein
MPSQTLLRKALSLTVSRHRQCGRLVRHSHVHVKPTTTRIHRRAFSAAPEQHEQHESESFLSGTSSLYAEQMYENYLYNPESVHESWRRYFDNLQNGVAYSEQDFSQPTAAPPSKASRRQAPQAAVYVRICSC